jgi:hypothetical protein
MAVFLSYTVDRLFLSVYSKALETLLPSRRAICFDLFAIRALNTPLTSLAG